MLVTKRSTAELRAMEVRVTMFMEQGYYYPGIIEVAFPPCCANATSVRLGRRDHINLRPGRTCS